MSFLDSLRYHLRVWRSPRAHERELDDEMQFHLSLDAMQREHTARGSLTGAEAAFAARRDFGNVTQAREETRQMSGLGFFDMLAQDLRFAFRTFRRTPGFTAIAILTLAVGIGANTAIFSAVDAILLRPLPYKNPDELMKVSLILPSRNGQPPRDDMVWSVPKFRTFQGAQTVYSDLAITTDNQSNLLFDNQAERDYNEIVSQRYLPLLGVQPAFGRNFTADEDRGPDAHVVILGNALWKRSFNADSSVIGHTVGLDGVPYTIIGVLPAGFVGMSGRAEFFVPVGSWPADQLAEPFSHTFDLIARRKPGVSSARATAAVTLLGVMVDNTYPRTELREHWGATARDLDDTRTDPRVRQSLYVLLAAVGLVLLTACANVANLFLVRAAGRTREIAVRLAIGAGRGRLVRQLLTESVLLSAIGGVLGLAIAWWGVRMLSALNPASAMNVQGLSGIGAVNFSTIHLDASAFAFAAALALLTGIVFGLVPALQSTRPELSGALKGEEKRARVRGITSRNVLAVAEIAISLVLLAGSGLMVRSLAKLLAINPGFSADHVLTMRFTSPADASRDSLPLFYDRILERFAALPGVTSVGLGDCPPLNGGCSGTIVWLRDRQPVTVGTEPTVGVHWITPQWSTTMHVPLVRGRLFNEGDRVGAPKVVLVSESAAKQIWPNEDPIGKPLSVGQGGFNKDTAHVIGVVGDVNYITLESQGEYKLRDVYLSYYQSMRGRMMVYLRTTGDPLALAAPVRTAAHELSPQSPLYDVRTMESRVSDAASSARFRALLLALFAAMALALAVMGTYGVISFAVSTRTKEIGVRVALGASRGDVIRLIVGQGFGIAMAGAIIGLAGAFAATRVLSSLLYGVQPTDPLTFAIIVALLVGSVLVASWIPARRAATINPTEALRGG